VRISCLILNAQYSHTTQNARAHTHTWLLFRPLLSLTKILGHTPCFLTVQTKETPLQTETRALCVRSIPRRGRFAFSLSSSFDLWPRSEGAKAEIYPKWEQ
jgi:hypothetical protein